jgi:alkanesulfonate monooxygenase SsuD/methylene tetrahydromethanopterin reductase-like flavin-dependent oxidoreductase (luciferase family)
MENYDQVFQEKLELLLRIRDEARVTWQGCFRAPLSGATVVPRADRGSLPVWVGVGGTPSSAERAGRLGLPMILGYIGGPVERLVHLARLYRAAGREAGTGDRLRLGLGVHFFASDDAGTARETYAHYRDFLRPKRPGGGGFDVSPEQFRAGLARDGHLLVGTPAQVTEKAVRLYEAVRFDRLQALVDWGGLPEDAVTASVTHLGATVAPALREVSRRRVQNRAGGPASTYTLTTASTRTLTTEG